MFGLFYMVANLIGVTVSGTKRAIDNSRYKDRGWEKYNNGNDLGKHTYYDSEGKQRDLTSDHIMFTYRKDGDLFIEDTKTFKVRNLSEEKRKEEIRNILSKEPDTIAVFYKYWNHSNSELKDETNIGISGKVFKDIRNGQLYFERYITWQENDYSKAGVNGNYKAAYFYLRISDGKIASVSDLQLSKDKENNIEADYDEFISFFNSEQEKGGFVVRNRNQYAKGKGGFYLENEMTYNK